MSTSKHEESPINKATAGLVDYGNLVGIGIQYEVDGMTYRDRTTLTKDQFDKFVAQIMRIHWRMK